MGKQVKIDENTLNSIIAESVKKVLNERHLDIVDSGVGNYKGTGSDESNERMKKIRAKQKFRSPETDIPGKGFTRYDKEGNLTYKVNDSTWRHAQKSFGGRNGGSKVCDPVREYARELEKKNSEPLKALAQELKDVCYKWEYDYNK